MPKTTKIIGLKKFREDVMAVAESVAEGHEYVVVRRSEPLFKVSMANTTPGKPVDLEPWKKFIGMLKGKRGPDPLKWQKKIRKEWETIE